MRPTPRRVLKTVCVVTVMGFLVMNLNLLVQTAEEDAQRRAGDLQALDGQQQQQQQSQNAHGGARGNESQPRGNQTRGNATGTQQTTKRAPGSGTAGSTPVYAKHSGLIAALASGPKKSPPELNATQIREFIVQSNSEQVVHNLDKFDLRTGSETLVLVVQVHNRADYLKHLIDSLRKAKNIEHSLLIFSHDFYDENMNNIVKAIDFCPVLQIFYPYPIQIYPKEFPGDDANDCPRNMKKNEALQKRCNNAENPDKYGHYREAKYSQTKHHWFWKLDFVELDHAHRGMKSSPMRILATDALLITINHVFDHVRVMKRFMGPVLFIEEDHYLVEDFIPVLRQMFKLAQESCKECSIMTLGTYDKNPSYAGSSRKGLIYSWVFGSDDKLADVDVTDWVSTKHNMGMALNRTVWEKIKKCGQNFCRFDDYNWDWSLQYISLTCIPGRLKVMLSKSPRIFHIGECGVHHKGKRCNSEEKVRQIENLLTRNKQYLYPDKLIINGYPRSMARMPKPNGGWGDHRDHELCTRFRDDSTHGSR